MNRYQTMYDLHTDPSSIPHLSTAWMPLEGLAEQWAHFGAHATDVSTLHATSAAFAALQHETEAYQHHKDACYGSGPQDAHPLSLEQALASLQEALARWTEVMLALEPLAFTPAMDETEHRFVEAMHHRQRVMALIGEVGHEQLMAFCPVLSTTVGEYTSSPEKEV